jgi:hypothetical protein
MLAIMGTSHGKPECIAVLFCGTYTIASLLNYLIDVQMQESVDDLVISVEIIGNHVLFSRLCLSEATVPNDL